MNQRKTLAWLGLAVVGALWLAPFAFGQAIAPPVGGSSVNPTFTSPVLAPDGTAAAPGISFANGTGQGVYRSSSNSVNIVNGVSANFLKIQDASGGVTFIASNPAATLALNSSVGSQIAYAGQSITADGATITLSTGGNPVKSNVGYRLNTSGGAEPTCDATVRGTVWYTQGAAGVADKMQVCAKSSADAYAWRSMATIP